MEEKAPAVSWDEAFRALSTRWSRRQIRGFDPEDLAQEVLARVWVWLNKPEDADSRAGNSATRATFGPPQRVLMGFAHRLEKECIRDKTRTQCRFIPLTTAVDAAKHDEDGAEIEILDEVGLASPIAEPQRCITSEELTRGIKLTPRDRHLLTMLTEGLGTVELSANLHCSEAAVDSRKRRLFAKIRAVVDPAKLDP
ncbi:MAG: LuxR C-terminal-related transcriptional regulator [Planctomycetota bacterium]